uniref:Nucleotid_trans domain-containing protein n=1 Tax=Mesocestoides corti TaxID=53468 RepID=A0A5K3FNB5_MESCO
LLKVKLLNATAHKTFHTQLYTCAVEFDFLPLSTWVELTRTGLLPGALVAVLVALLEMLWRPSKSSKFGGGGGGAGGASAHGDVCSTTEQRVIHSAKSQSIQHQIMLARETSLLITHVVTNFVIIQLFSFGVLASLVMRLKLFFTPQLCLTLAILAQPRLFFGSQKLLLLVQRWKTDNRQPVGQKRGGDDVRPVQHPVSSAAISWKKLLIVHSVFVGAISASAHRGMHNLLVEWSKRGQFSDFTTETMLQWAARLPNRTDGRPWVFTGAMPTMATLRLGLVVPNAPGKFAVTNHPHYENAGIRLRTELAYAVCSRKPAEAVWAIYRRILKADFVVIERAWCLSAGAKPGCASVELWDTLDPGLADRASGPLCADSFDRAGPSNLTLRYFRPVFVATDQSLVVWRVSP